MKATKPKELPPVSLISSGLFFVVTGNTAEAHWLLLPEERARFYERARIAANCRDRDGAMRQTIRLAFGSSAKDACDAIPAASVETLTSLMDEYEGPAKDAVRYLAASYLAGSPWHTGRPSQDPGAHDRMPVKPKLPEGPAGAASPEVDALAALLEMVPS